MHKNTFGFVRLVLALSVIVSHAAEMTDGSRHREFLASIFGLYTLGEIAVSGFFLVSGYLVCQSLLTSASYQHYLLKRVVRIYPAFMVCFLLCLFVVAPLFGGRLTIGVVAYNIFRMFKLDLPLIDGTFSYLPIATINGSMWTILYEFKCYLMLMGLGWLGLMNRRAVVLGVALSLLLLSAAHPAVFAFAPKLFVQVIGDPYKLCRLFGLFLMGSSFYLYRDAIKYNGFLALLGFGAAVSVQSSPFWCELIVATFGAYALFWFVFQVKAPALQRVGEKVDVSYGVYLYAWPIQQLILTADPTLPIPASIAATALLATGAARLSWTYIEEPALRLKGSADEVLRSLKMRFRISASEMSA